MSGWGVPQVPWGPFVRESMAGQGVSTWLLLQKEQLPLDPFPTPVFLGTFLH